MNQIEDDHLGFVDIHCHILPGIDDGARTIEESLALAREAAANGVSDIIATPHLNRELFIFSIEDAKAAFEKLQAAITAEQIPITLHLGAEVKAAPNIPEGVKSGTIPTLAGSDYLLLEFPFDSVPPFARELVFQIQLAGITPILAHPERNARFQRDPSLLESYLSAGCLTQINSTSLTGHLGRSSQKAAIAFLTNKWVNMIGSDGHKAGGRGVNFKEALSVAAKQVGMEEALKMVLDNPRRILDSVAAATDGKS